MIWGVLALILMDWHRIRAPGRFPDRLRVRRGALRRCCGAFPKRDRWYVALVWLALVALGADWSGLHFMVGAFLAGAVINAEWFPQDRWTCCATCCWW